MFGSLYTFRSYSSDVMFGVFRRITNYVSEKILTDKAATELIFVCNTKFIMRDMK